MSGAEPHLLLICILHHVLGCLKDKISCGAYKEELLDLQKLDVTIVTKVNAAENTYIILVESSTISKFRKYP